MDTHHRFHNRIAITDNNVVDFMGIKNGIFLSDGKSGNVIYFDDGVLKTRSENGSTSVLSQNMSFVNDNVIIGRDPVLNGFDSIAIGANTLKNSSIIGGSIAIGGGSMGNCGKTELNIAIGKDTLRNVSDSYNIAIGDSSMKEMTGPLVNHNISIGKESMANSQNNAINIVSIGSQACSDISGSNFQSIYIGDKAAQKLQSDVISINNIGMGSHVLQEASNITDVICLGSHAGKNINGVRGIVIGANSTRDTTGKLNDDILIGTSAGSFREYNDSKGIFIGSQAGLTGSGIENVSVGVLSSTNQKGNHNCSVGSKAGSNLIGDGNVTMGLQSGESLNGNNNICLGVNSGKGVSGSRNIIVGENSQIGDILDDSVVIGTNIFVKGRSSIVIGTKTASLSSGYLNGDILIGSNAGAGQRYSENLDESKGMLLIGANAGVSNNLDSSSDLVCLGHSSGRSEEQSFHKTVMLGNYAGSFSGKVNESVILGHSAGVNISGDNNVYIGSHSGLNCKGSNNILIGNHCGDLSGALDSDINDTLILGNKTCLSLLGDLTNGNLVIGAQERITQWTDTKGTLGFMNTSRPKSINTVDGLVYNCNGHLEYSTQTKTQILTYPYKYVDKGELNGVTFLLDIVNGTSLLTIKIIPEDKLDYFVSCEILLHVKDNAVVVSPFKNDKWKFDISGNHLILKSTISIKGILYMEVLGENIIKKL